MNRKKSLSKVFSLVVKGFVMGSADVVPGVSGGTMALVLGIYERLINSIRCVNKRTISLIFKFRIKEFFQEVPWRFLGAIGAGILLAIFTLARPIEWLLEHKQAYVWAFFFGLVVASIFFVRRKVRKFTALNISTLIAGGIIAYLIAGLLPTTTPEGMLYYFISGVIAICAMILPGISGSYLLLIMGKYEQILHAVNDREFSTLLVFTLGALVGIVIFAKFLSWLLQHYHDFTMAALIGLMIGSLRRIWPWQMHVESNVHILGLILLGILSVLLIEKIGKKYG